MSITTIFSAVQPAFTLQSISDTDGINLLIEMSDDMVKQKVGTAFTAQLQHSDRVQSVFFPCPAELLTPLPQNLNDWVGQVASALIAMSLAQCSGHGFSGTANGGQAQAFLNSNLAPANENFMALAMNNYQKLFPAYCQAKDKDKTSFNTFLNGSYGSAAHWGTLLAQHLSSNDYITQQLIKLNPAVDSSGWYQVYFANIYKVICLNPAEVESVLNAWQPHLVEKLAPPSTGPWTVYEYMLAGSYSLYSFMGQVQTAIAIIQSSTETYGCHGGPAASCTTVTTTTYGAAVNNWLSNNRNLNGFINGPTTGNVESHSEGSGGGGCGCFVPGTPILMADGTTKPIETVQASDTVISRNGGAHQRSAQDVHWCIEEHELLFGINEYAPFFNASHPFMTTDGWKSMAPNASQRINPDLDVKQLQVGDILLQAESLDPLRYREVKVDKITKMLARDAESLAIYSLHLAQENPGYHAHGFLVAVNYPQLREDHFVKAFEGITEAERLYLRSHFDPLIPFLRRGLGNYVSEILRRALGGSNEVKPIGAPKNSVTHH